MKATEAKLMSFLQKSPQFIIPIYQRTYSWTDSRWSESPFARAALPNR